MPRAISILALSAAIATAAPDGGASLWYDKPAANWLEALPVGNGSLGGMIFGGTDKERIQFNEQTLWTGDEIKMGDYQPFGDLFIDSTGLKDATHYRRELDLSDAVHRTIFTANGVKFTREVFSSHPDKVMVIRLSADKPGAVSGTIRLTDMHEAKIAAAGDTITATGSLENGLAYESRVRVLAEKGKLSVSGDKLSLENADSAIILLAAATDFANSPEQEWRGEKPGPKLDRILAAASGKAVGELRAYHIADHRSLFGRVKARISARHATTCPPTAGSPTIRNPANPASTRSSINTAATCSSPVPAPADCPPTSRASGTRTSNPRGIPATPPTSTWR